MDLLVETGRRDPQTSLEMAKLLLNMAEEHLQNEEVANQLLGWDPERLCGSASGGDPERMRPPG